MPRSTRSFLFPDVNVWIALTYRGHIHHRAAMAWLESAPDDSELCFCRLTQLGFLRLLTTAAVMGNKVLTQAGAWDVYDDWLENGRAGYVEEPPAVELTFRSLSQSSQMAPKDWADSYISAFAQVSGLRLVTFDQTLHRRTANSLLLKPMSIT
jgi:toxin-antitoxin system PIN domain toxin